MTDVHIGHRQHQHPLRKPVNLFLTSASTVSKKKLQSVLIEQVWHIIDATSEPLPQPWISQGTGKHVGHLWLLLHHAGLLLRRGNRQTNKQTNRQVTASLHKVPALWQGVVIKEKSIRITYVLDVARLQRTYLGKRWCCTKIRTVNLVYDSKVRHCFYQSAEEKRTECTLWKPK